MHHRPSLAATGRARDRALAEIAAAQHGLVSARDLARVGITRGQQQHRVRSGQWELVAPHVWRIAGTPATWEQALRIGLLSLGDDAVVSHRSAAALHGFDGYRPGPVELLVPRPHREARAPFTVHSTRVLGRVDRAAIGDVPVTTPARTIIDLAALGLPAERLAAAIDSAVRSGGTSPAYLRKRLAALRTSGRRGVRLLDALLLDSGGHSHLERAFLRLMREHGFPRPRCQVIHRRDGRTVARVDFLFDSVRPPVVVEVNGRRGHASDAERAKDARRRNELQLAGFIVLEFVTEQVLGDPTALLATVREHLRRSSPPRSPVSGQRSASR